MVTKEMLDILMDCSLADCKPATAKAAWPCKTKKDENPMNSYSSATVVTADSIERDQRRALLNTAYDVFNSKKTDAKRQFGLLGDDTPETITEAVKRIADGRFVIPEQYKDNYASMSYIQWRDPSVKADKDGYAKAKAELTKEYEALKLRLSIIPVADGLTAVEKYRDAK